MIGSTGPIRDYFDSSAARTKSIPKTSLVFNSRKKIASLQYEMAGSGWWCTSSCKSLGPASR